MTAADRYSTPTAFRRALTDRLKATSTGSQWTVSQLQRHVAYDRLLERLYEVDSGWIVKGATALLARDLSVRGSLDIDLFRAFAQETCESDVRRAATIDLGDWFAFEIGPMRAIANAGMRLPVTSFIGATVWVGFHVDLVAPGVTMTARAEEVHPVARGIIPTVTQHGYRAYPLVDHVADKVAATYERHGHTRIPSTRYRDLVDLVAIATGTLIAAGDQEFAIRSEFRRRGLPMPADFDVPDRALWERGYAAEASRSLLSCAMTLDDALTVVRSFLDPLLHGTAAGVWNPRTRRWEGHQPPRL